MKRTNAQVRKKVMERLARRPVKVPVETVRVGDVVEYVRVTGGLYSGIVVRKHPRLRQLRVEMYANLVRRRDGTYGAPKGRKPVVLRSDVIHVSQVEKIFANGGY